MIKLKIIHIDGCLYHLQASQGHTYCFHISFYDLPRTPKVNDTLFVDESLFTENLNVFQFGRLEGHTLEKRQSNISEKELAIFVSENEKIYLKRYYG